MRWEGLISAIRIFEFFLLPEQIGDTNAAQKGRFRGVLFSNPLWTTSLLMDWGRVMEIDWGTPSIGKPYRPSPEPKEAKWCFQRNFVAMDAVLQRILT